VLPKMMLKRDALQARGGIELAMMSCTTNKDVALEYARRREGKGQAAVVFEMEQGFVDRGADLSWLSIYPEEAEFLFPPLTALEISSTRIEGPCLVLVARPSVNPSIVPIEDVVSRREKLLVEMSKTMRVDIETKLHQVAPAHVHKESPGFSRF